VEKAIKEMKDMKAMGDDDVPLGCTVGMYRWEKMVSD